ncbi:membrane protein [Pelistega indica]|uniref:Protein HflK n=1 Tax=Pelistega indica TaxID=1414851 RepID=V8G6S8_9BURK|nr:MULTISPECIES: FtsH protease activity modulator HflK [Pelistega]ETD72105.1 membrane protein [Pelistega indica]
MNIFNLNDPGWGKGNPQPPQNQQGNEPPRRPPQDNDTPPDLDQVFNDLSKRIKSVFGNGGKKDGNQPLGQPPRREPPQKLFKVGAVAIAVVAVGAWLASGFFIVREGQVGVVTQFGKYNRTVMPGFKWHIPSPFESVDLVDISRVRSFSVGYRDSARNKVLPEALMLTEDENIVDVQFDVQYRLKTGMPDANDKPSAAADYLFQTVSPDESVRQAAETAMREIVGKQSMNKILYESRTQAAIDVRQLMQNILDRYRTGIEVITVAIQNVQPPEQVQAAFEDAIKAGQDNERQKNEGYAYASKVIPEARGQASRILQDAEGYKAAIIGRAKGAAERFAQVEKEYANAPQVTRERMYLSTLEEVYANASKVMIDTKSGNNMLYLPIDKILEQNTSLNASSYGSSETSSASRASNESITTSNRAKSASTTEASSTEVSRDRNALNRSRSAQ